MSFAVSLHPLCCDAVRRNARPGPAQWAGLHLTRSSEDTARETARIWRGALLERALLGYLFDQAVRRCLSDDPGQIQVLDRAAVLRNGQRWRRFCDLAHDLARGRRTADALVGVTPWPQASPLEQRHVNALGRNLKKDAQRRNLNRLMAHSTKLSALTESADAMALLTSINQALHMLQFSESLLTWTLVGRFQPIRFERRVGRTHCAIASLYMSERELCNHARVDTTTAQSLRAKLLVGIRKLNALLGWTRVVDAFPERLAMTQGDLRKKRKGGGEPPSSGSHGMSLDELLRDLASRNTEQEGDAALWEAIENQPHVFQRYARIRHEVELIAEEGVSSVQDTVSNRHRKRWFLYGALGTALATAGVLYVQSGPAPETQTLSDTQTHHATAPATTLETHEMKALHSTFATLGLLVGSTLPSPAEASSFDASKLKHITIQSEMGDVRLIGSSGTDVDVAITPPSKTAGLSCETRADLVSGDVLEIRREGLCMNSAPLEIKLPSGVQVHLTQTQGVLDLKNTQVDLRAEIATGSVRLDGTTGGTLQLDLANGSLTAKNARLDNLILELGNGSIDYNGTLNNAQIDMGNGNAHIEFTTPPGKGLFRVGVAMGSMTLTLPAGSQVETTSETVMGSVDNELGETAGAPFQIQFSSAMGHLKIKKR